MRRPLISFLLITLLLLLAGTTHAQLTDKLLLGKNNDRRWRIIPFPVLFYQPETSLGFGLSTQVLWRFKNDSTSNMSYAGLTGYYTLKKQYVLNSQWNIQVKDSKYRNAGAFVFQYFPNSFYGIGNDTDKDDRERYTGRFILLKHRFVIEVAPNFFIGPQYRLEKLYDLDVEENGLLETGDIPGGDGYLASGAGIAAAYDTRDNALYPFTGTFIQFSNHFYLKAFGSTQQFYNIKIDARKYVNPGEGTHVLAMQGYLQFLPGNPPFQDMAQLGGPFLMRGHFQGRYRDRHMFIGQVDYRFPIWWRFTGAAFVGIGDVTHDFKDLRFNNLKYSMGAGLRFTIDAKERIMVRFDYAYGLKDNHGFYLQIHEAF